ncbi:hypothetical protein PWT90_10875 [Aphanocladium album]|nr:hypothetical protein PWT90_10875 [Aphanocladium album]
MKTSTIVVTVATLAAAAPKPISSAVDLGAPHDIEWTEEAMVAAADELAEKYEVQGSAYSMNKRATSGSIPLTDETKYPLDKSYYGNGQVNTQTLSIKFDTGSKTFYYPGPSCPSNECPAKVRYNEQGEDEHNVTTTAFGGTGNGSSRTGETFLDTVTIAGIRVEKTQIVSMTQRVGSPAQRGIMGLSFGLLQGKPATFFEAAMAQGKVAANEVSFFLGRLVSGTQGKSELTIGGRNPAHYTGNLETLPVVDYRHWNVEMDGFVLNGQLVPNTNGIATMDTGTSLIIGPELQAAAFWAGVPGSKGVKSKSHPYTFYEFPCNAKFTFALRLNGKDFNIDPKDYSIKIIGNGKCTGLIAGGPFDTWITGDSFLKNWYSIYSYDAADGKPAVLLGAAKA